MIQQLLMDVAVRGGNVAYGQRIRIALHIRDAATCFLNEQDAGSQIPYIEIMLPEATDSACRYIG